jgi:putative membrane protein
VAKFLYWLLLPIVAVVIAAFAVSNRESVALALWPLPVFVELPLYLAMLAGLVVGFLSGEIAARMAVRRWRREVRRRGRRIAALERELAATRAQLDQHPRQAAVLAARG